MLIGIIPARAGSKGIPGKNVRRLCEHPLIAWTIETARASGVLDRIFVSTDGEDIAEVSRAYGAEVIDRPSSLATDDAPAKSVIRHVADTIAEVGQQASLIAYLQPTSPLRTAADIISTLDLVRKQRFDSAASFTPATPHPDRAFLVNDVWEANPVFDHDRVWQMRQARSPQFHLNGAIYVVNPRLMPADESPQILGGRIGAHVMPPERSIDIDTSLDFDICELLLKGAVRPTPVEL